MRSISVTNQINKVRNPQLRIEMFLEMFKICVRSLLLTLVLPQLVTDLLSEWLRQTDWHQAKPSYHCLPTNSSAADWRRPRRSCGSWWTAPSDRPSWGPPGTGRSAGRTGGWQDGPDERLHLAITSVSYPSLSAAGLHWPLKSPVLGQSGVVTSVTSRAQQPAGRCAGKLRKSEVTSASSSDQEWPAELSVLSCLPEKYQILMLSSKTATRILPSVVAEN